MKSHELNSSWDSEPEIVEKMLEKYDVPKEQVEKDVTMVIDKLRSIGAIE